MNFVNLGTYPPRQCGIASFSRDLRDSLVNAGHNVLIAAISDTEPYTYPAEVYYEIEQETREDYLRTARKINNNPQIHMVIIQHEYGVFGGDDGEYVIDFVNHLEKPFMMVTHTVLPHPTAGQKVILQFLARKAAVVISMTRRSACLLEKVYDVHYEKITVIPHGVPLFERKDREALKMFYGYTGRQVVTTFGLIGPSKGLEIGITAVKKLVEKHPDLLYIIAGRTHPVLLRKEGESYREKLLKMCSDLGLDNHVQFVNRFLEVEELGDYLYLTDVYLSPYPNRDQAVSGTLAYAVGCGKAIVSTPYEYALDILKKQRCGLVAPEATSGALAKLLDEVLSQPALKKVLERRATPIGDSIKWPGVADRYVDLARAVRRTRTPARLKRQALSSSMAAVAAKEKGTWG